MKKIINKLKLNKKVKKNFKFNPLFSFIIGVMITVTGIAAASDSLTSNIGVMVAVTGIVAASDSLTSNVGFTLASYISSTNIQNVINEVYTEASNSGPSPK